jgi:hypothetical protein
MKKHLDLQIIEKLLNVVEELLKRQKIFFEEETGSKVISKNNSLTYQYLDEDKLIEKE